MNHEEIEARHFVDLYITRQLGAEDSARFEEHFVDCPQCLDSIEVAERFQLGLKRVPPDSFPGVRRHWQWAAAALVLVSLLTLWQISRATGLQRELAATRAAASDWKRRYEAEAAEKDQIRRPATDHPLVAAAFSLNIVRSAGGDSTPPPNRIPLPANSQWVALSLDCDLEPGVATLIANLKDSSGKQLWQEEGLAATPGVPISIIVPSGLLPPGDYALTVQGKSSAGLIQPVGRYRFRVSRQ